MEPTRTERLLLLTPVDRTVHRAAYTDNVATLLVSTSRDRPVRVRFAGRVRAENAVRRVEQDVPSDDAGPRL
jgi:hypothetical protein